MAMEGGKSLERKGQWMGSGPPCFGRSPRAARRRKFHDWPWKQPLRFEMDEWKWKGARRFSSFCAFIADSAGPVAAAFAMAGGAVARPREPRTTT